MKIILASASPRRAELLEQIGLSFVKIATGFAELENVTSLTFGELAVANAKGKANSLKIQAEELVIGADTIVVLGQEVLGKPKNAQEAKSMLRKLAGKTHQVFTGVCVKNQRGTYSECVETRVTMRALNEEEIEQYVKTNEPFDKAGAYGIQGFGSLLVEKIDGCYFNVVGLPLVCLKLLLEKAGFRFEYKKHALG